MSDVPLSRPPSALARTRADAQRSAQEGVNYLLNMFCGGTTDDGRSYIGLDAFLREALNHVAERQREQTALISDMSLNLETAQRTIDGLATRLEAMEEVRTPTRERTRAAKEEETPTGQGLRARFGSDSTRGKDREDGWSRRPLGESFLGETSRPGPSGSSTTPTRPPPENDEVPEEHIGAEIPRPPGEPAPRTSATPGGDSYKSKMPAPDVFEGTRGVAAKQWFELALLYLGANEASFPTEHLKVGFILSKMKHGTDAMGWAFPLLKEHNDHNSRHPDIQSMAALNHAFLANFVDISEKIQAERAIKRLFQTRSASEYTAKFRTLAMELDWGRADQGLKSIYFDGLKANVRAKVRETMVLIDTDAATTGDRRSFMDRMT